MSNDQAKVDGPATKSIETRRNALRKMGLIAAYSTPVVLGVLTPKKAAMASTTKVPIPFD